MGPKYAIQLGLTVFCISACGEETRRSTSSRRSSNNGSVADAGVMDSGSAASTMDAGHTNQPMTPGIDRFVGEFDCSFIAETFTGGGSSGPATTPMVLISSKVDEETLRWISPGTRENLFQVCPSIFSVSDNEATYVGGDECEDSFESGSATTNDENSLVGEFKGTFGGAAVEVEVDCARRIQTGPGAIANDFLGQWSCTGETNLMGMSQTVDFDLELARTLEDKIRVKETSGTGTVFVFCPAYFTPVTMTTAVLDEQSRCDQIPATIVSNGLSVVGGKLMGDYAAEPAHFAGGLSFTCERN